MKIEMGESLFYSWLRHVKECQLVQTNWKISPSWEIKNEEEAKKLMNDVKIYFEDKYGYNLFNKNSFEQLLQQAEVDVIGVYSDGDENQIYAIDVAFHGAGLNYGLRDETIKRVIKKCFRTAMCINCYLDNRDADIIFAAPKINNSILLGLEPCIDDLNNIFEENDFDFRARLIANDDFKEKVMQPILISSGGISDTSELFLRSYQMFGMFEKEFRKKKSKISTGTNRRKSINRINKDNFPIEIEDMVADYQEMKVGKIAQTVLRNILESGNLSSEIIEKMQTFEYSKKNFDLQFPLLVKKDSDYDRVRYYKKPVLINGENYKMCSQWYETQSNDDKSYLLHWIAMNK